MDNEEKTSIDTVADTLFRMRLELAREEFLRERKARYFCISTPSEEYRRKEKKDYE